MDIHRHIFLLSGFENTFFFISSTFFPLSCNDNNDMTYKWPNSSFFNFQENANQENCRQYSCITFFNWQIGTRNLTKRKFIAESSFFTSWTITSVNTHGRTCKKTKVYIYLYISLYENLYIYESIPLKHVLGWGGGAGSQYNWPAFCANILVHFQVRFQKFG